MGRIRKGEDNHMWKGGRTVTEHGYVLLRVGTDHHLADVRGYAYEHRVVGETVLGRRLTADEVVHHRNHNRQDNRPENLIVMTKAWHGVEHRTAGKRRRMPGEPNNPVPCECGCGAVFLRFDTGGRPRRFISGHNNFVRALP